jgi:hypothetical protein
MVCSVRERADVISQRIASAWPRSVRTSTGNLVGGTPADNGVNATSSAGRTLSSAP